MQPDEDRLGELGNDATISTYVESSTLGNHRAQVNDSFDHNVDEFRHRGTGLRRLAFMVGATGYTISAEQGQEQDVRTAQHVPVIFLTQVAV